MEGQWSQIVLWTVLLCCGVICWFILGMKTMEIDYERHKHLVDMQTGTKRKPMEMFDLAKVINYTDEYINSTNAQERLYDLEYNLNFENPFMIDQSYTDQEQLLISGWPVANQTRCGQQLGWISDQLNRHKNYTFLKGRLGLELTRLMDSFGKPESGLYSGMVTWLGSYKQCQQLQLNGGQIRTRYCLARMRPKWWPENETIIPKSTLRIGICVPETCDTNSFDYHHNKIESLVKFDLPELYKNGLDFESMFCLPDERSPIRKIPFSGQVYLYVLCVWLSLVFTATIVREISTNKRKKFLSACQDEKQHVTSQTKTANNMTPITNSQMSPADQCYKQPHQLADQFYDDSSSGTSPKEQLLASLSIRCSFKAFKTNSFRVRYSRGERVRVDLSAIDFFKIAMAICVVLGHSAYLASLYTRSLSNRIEINTSESGRLALSLTRCVDTFFFFFGLLTTYTLMRKFTLSQLSNPIIWLAINLGVLLRISPVFMLVYWYSRSISPYTGAGPWWDYGVHKYSMKGVCMADPWWRSIPYFGCSNGLPAPACLLPGWFIVSYSQISIILPLITYILCKSPNNLFRYALISFLSLASALQIALKMQAQTSIRIESFSLYGSFLTDLFEKFESTGFMSTSGRLGSVSVGCLIGYLLKQYELGNINEWPRWIVSKITVTLVILLHLVIIFLPIIGYKIVQTTQHLTTLGEFVGPNVLVILIWPILNSILLINYATVCNKTYLVRFCSHSFWHIFNRLGLCIYLVHWEVIFIGMTNFEQAPTHGFITDIIKTWAFGVFFSIILAFIIHILIEAPLSSLLTLVAKSFGNKIAPKKLAAVGQQQY